MDLVYIKKTYDKELTLHGGINAMLWNDIDKLEDEMRKVIPIMRENGGYIFSTDRSIPSNVGLSDFRRIVELAKQLDKCT